MSDVARPKSAGDQLTANEVNRDLPVSINAGESIDVSSNPQAVYVKASDGKVYKTDADFDDERTHGFIGFAMTTGVVDSPCYIQKDGVVGGFSGLTKGSIYYLSGTAGAISTTPTTYPKQVGIAISATELLIRQSEHWEYLGSGSFSSGASGSGVGCTCPARTMFVLVQIDNGSANAPQLTEAVISRYGKTSCQQNTIAGSRRVVTISISGTNINWSHSGDIAGNYPISVWFYS